MKKAQYSSQFHTLTYWDSKNTTITIDCRNIKCARLVLLTQEKLKGTKQDLEFI